MAKLLISAITEQSLKLGNLANQVNNSGISKKDEWIDDKEFFKFQQDATALKNKGEISQKEFNAIFGLVMTDNTKVNNDSISYNKAMKNVEKTETKQKKINELKNNIAKLRNKLYKGKWDEIRNRGCGAGLIIGIPSLCTGAVLGMKYGAFAGASIGGPVGAGIGLVLGAAAGIGVGALATHGIVSGTRALSGDKEFMRKCEQEDPTTYRAIQYAERELAKLEK